MGSLGDDLATGFKLVVVSFVWGLPVLVVTLPTVVGAAIMDSGGDAAVFGLMLLLCGTCLSVAYGLFLALVQPGYTIAFARDERIRSGLAFTQIWQWTRANISDVAVVAIVYVVGSLIISTVAPLVGVVACVVGLVVTVPLGILVVTYFQYHLYGQLPVGVLGGGFGSTDSGFASGLDDADAMPAASTVVVTAPAPASDTPVATTEDVVADGEEDAVEDESVDEPVTDAPADGSGEEDVDPGTADRT
ncbi:MAG: DUF4013 domain-containing protein [Caldilineaceae bacterium]